MKRIRTAQILLLASAALMFLTVAVFPASASASSPHWEQIAVAAARDGNVDSDADEGAGKVDAFVRDGYIYITTSAEVNIKVFTILGQPVARKTVPPGTVRLRLPSRGVYILKAGTYTRRLNV